MTTNNKTPLGVALPPIPDPDFIDSFAKLYLRHKVERYGLACAKAVADDRDSQLQAASARIAELEARLRESTVAGMQLIQAADQENAELRRQLEAKGADAEWKSPADALPDDGRFVAFEVGGNTGSFDYLNGELFACRFSAVAARYSTGFWTPGLSLCVSRWRYIDPPPAIDAARSAQATAGADQQQAGVE